MKTCFPTLFSVSSVFGLLIFFSSLGAFALEPSSAKNWDLNDVSYLMPLPTALDQDWLLNIRNQGATKGPLIPEAMIDRLPFLTQMMSHEQEKQVLRVISLRIDPCFPLLTPRSCQKQIRMTWQPLTLDPFNEISTVDASMHSFYVLNDTEFTALLQDLLVWKKKWGPSTRGLALQVHPAWAKNEQKPQVEFQKIVLKFAGAENLSRLTIMVLRGNDTMWTFAAYEPKTSQTKSAVREKEWALIPVPRLGNRTSQTFVNSAFPFENFQGGLSPMPAGSDTLNELITDSGQYAQGSEDLIRRQIGAAVRIENPQIFNPENMDCVSCHVTQPTLQWARNKRADLAWEQTPFKDEYRNADFNLTNLSAEIKNTRSIRGLGYFGRSQVLSQRVINESAEVAEAVNRIMLK